MTSSSLGALDVVELRRYVMKPGRRDDLIDLFEREFIETQEACGMVPIAHFRDSGDPDSFVWFRGFGDMDSRRRALQAFYLESAAWLRNREAANDTMIDSDNVLLLRPARSNSGFDLRGLERGGDTSYVGTAIFLLEDAMSARDVESFECSVLPQLERCSQRVAYFVTEESENDFPRLPVRDEWAFVVTASCANAEHLERWIDVLRSWRGDGEFLRLRPAARSLYR
jgi:hypothetical protein